MTRDHFASLYDELLDTITSGVAVYQVTNDGLRGSDYVVLDFNRSALELEGKTKDEVVGKSLFDLRPQIDDFGLIPVFRKVWKTGEPGFYPAKVYVDQVFANYYENRVFRLSHNRIAAVYDDVTQSMRAQDALRQNEMLLREVIDSIDKAIAIYEPVQGGRDFVFVGMNKAAEPITHYSAEEVVGRRIGELFPGEASIGLIDNLNEALATGKTVRIPLKQYKDKRITQWVENTIFSLPSGKVVAMFDDTSEKRMAEQALKESEQRVRLALRIGGIGNWEYDLQTETFWASEEAKMVFGFDTTDDSFSMQRMEGCIPERLRVHQAMVDLIQKQTPYDIEFDFLPPGDLPRRTLASMARLLNDEQGEPWKVAGVVQDITEKRRQQDKIRQLEQFTEQSQRMETVGRLAGGIAHDFNNLLTVINVLAEFAIGDLKSEDPIRADIESILDAGKRAATLTQQLLAFSRKQVLTPKVLDLNESIRSINSMLGRILGEDIIVQTVLADDLGRVNADPGQLDQVLMNLAVNARDVMNKGGKLTIRTVNVNITEQYASTHPNTEAGQYVMFSVADSGEGMSPEVMAKIFEPFYSTKEKGRGTGLGLAMVYGIVIQSKGDITVQSEPGQGTTFEVYLPRVEDPMSERISTSDSKTTTFRGSETVLIVEDERSVRELIQRILGSAGYTVLTAANGGEALLHCERHKDGIDLMLTDVVMPLMSGHELTVRLAKIFPRLKTLYMSGYTDDAIMHHDVLSQGTPFIAKPFSASALLENVRMVLDRR